MALQLDNSAYVACGTNAGLLGDVFTVLAWVYHTDAGLNPLVAWTDAAGFPMLSVDWATSRPIIYFDNDCFQYFNGGPSLNQWSHVAFTSPGNTGADVINSKYYLNAVSQSVNATNSSGDGVAKTRFRIGANAAQRSGDIIAEVSLWNRVLSQPEIQTYMHRKLTDGESGLVGYWPLDDAGLGTHVPIKDYGAESGIPNNGVMTGFGGNPWVGGPPVNRGLAL